MVFANNDETKRFLKKNVISNIEYSSTSEKYYVTKYRTLLHFTFYELKDVFALRGEKLRQ